MKNIYDSVFQTFKSSADLGMGLLTTDKQGLSSNYFTINKKKYLNFCLNDYLGLTQDKRVKQGAIDAIKKHGAYSSVSKVFIKIDKYQEAEEQLSNMFGKPCLLFSRTTIAHTGILPVIINSDDAILVDHHAHASIKLATDSLKVNGISVEVIKHNHIGIIEDKIKELSIKYKKIWYLADSVYSMFGDSFPFVDLMALIKKYPQFHLYIDDSHGISWTGENGRGFAPDKIGYHPQITLITSLGKGFGAGGGVAVFYDERTKLRCEVCAPPLTFSSPIAPPTLGAIIASAKIHLTNEIYTRQADLREKIQYFIELAHELQVPIIGDTYSPVFLFPGSTPEITNEINYGLLKRSIYMCVTHFPAVPANNSGIRIMICNYHTKENIQTLLYALRDELDKALDKRKLGKNDIIRFYKIQPENAEIFK